MIETFANIRKVIGSKPQIGVFYRKMLNCDFSINPWENTDLTRLLSNEVNYNKYLNLY